VEGMTRRVDLGHAASDYFVNVVTAGLTERIVVGLSKENKKRFGRLAYVFAMCRALSRVRGFHAQLQTPEQELEFQTLQVVIGNGRYHAGPFKLAPEASITEGKLSVYALATTNRAAFFRLAWKLRTGRQCELPEVYSLSTVGGRLVTSPNRKVVVDGEIAGTTPIDFRVVPQAISVRVPTTFKG
jgi:diacylglycerol kinase family enzyme